MLLDQTDAQNQFTVKAREHAPHGDGAKVLQHALFNKLLRKDQPSYYHLHRTTRNARMLIARNMIKTKSSLPPINALVLLLMLDSASSNSQVSTRTRVAMQVKSSLVASRMLRMIEILQKILVL
jgi:hypothetical protein